jgi:hypothetical protein
LIPHLKNISSANSSMSRVADALLASAPAQQQEQQIPGKLREEDILPSAPPHAHAQQRGSNFRESVMEEEDDDDEVGV